MHPARACSLGDYVAIMATGRLRAVGTPLFLKSTYGAGFNVQLLAEPSRMDELRDLVRVHLPDAEVRT